jgi:hypothetical protein
MRKYVPVDDLVAWVRIRGSTGIVVGSSRQVEDETNSSHVQVLTAG